MKGNLLIVEDSDDVRRLLRMTFEKSGYVMHEAGNGTDAVRIARELVPEVIVMDVTMPGAVDGVRACEIIRRDERLRSSFLVLVTARGGKRDIDLGYAAGADAYLVKPFSPARLLEIIETRGSAPGRAPGTPAPG